MVLVLMDEQFEPREIYEADRETLQESLAANSGSRRVSRGALSVARFKIIGERVWSSAPAAGVSEATDSTTLEPRSGDPGA